MLFENNYSQYHHNNGNPEGFKIRSFAICCPFLGLQKSMVGWGQENTFSCLHPTTDFEQPTDVHIADNLIWSCKMLFELFHKDSPISPKSP